MRFMRLAAALAGVALATGAVAAAEATPVPPHVAHVSFTASGKGPGHCKWHASGSKDEGTVKLRLTLDHCKQNQMRLRAAGESALPDTWHTGNWIDKVHQLTSINISPEVYADYGYDLQYCYRGCKHKGRVRYISLDNGAGAPVTLDAAMVTPGSEYEYGGKTCWEGPHVSNHTNPKGACWVGGIGLDKEHAHFLPGDKSTWCIGFAHHAGHYVAFLENKCTQKDNHVKYVLAGYVYYNETHLHCGWPFTLAMGCTWNKVFDDKPVGNIELLVDGEARYCLEDIAATQDAVWEPIHHGHGCSELEQGGKDDARTYWVWLRPGRRLYAVHVMNAEQTVDYCLFTDRPDLGRLIRVLPASKELTDLQFWTEHKV